MRQSVLALALCGGLALGAVVPGASEQQPLNHDESLEENIVFDAQQISAWWDQFVPMDTIKSAFADAAEAAESMVDTTVSAMKEVQDKAAMELNKLHHAQDGHKNKRTETVYQLISALPHTRRFAKLVGEFPDLVDILNSTDADGEYTIFVPHDDAFKDIPDDHEKPDKKLIEKVLQYHIGNGKFKAEKLVTSYTLPTILDEKWLGNEKQRLRTSWDLSGVKINFYSKVIAADIEGTNGVVHVVNHFLVPPPVVGIIISLFPAEFSTLLLAYEKTNFVKFVHGQKMAGSTVFAPSNKAFEALGPRANAFLFNTESGKKYLSAILKYGIVPNVTIYSDTVYDKSSSQEGVENTLPQKHYDLTTLLPKAHLGVDIGHFLGFNFIKINGFTDVSIHDAIARNGVIHVVNQVVLPPHKGRNGKAAKTADITVEELKECLSDYVDEDEFYWSEL